MDRTEGSFRFKPFTVHDVVYLVLELVGKRVCVCWRVTQSCIISALHMLHLKSCTEDDWPVTQGVCLCAAGVLNRQVLRLSEARRKEATSRRGETRVYS